MHSFQLLTTPCLELPVEKEKRAARLTLACFRSSSDHQVKACINKILHKKKKTMVITQNTNSRDLHPKANHPSVLKKQPEVH